MELGMTLEEGVYLRSCSESQQADMGSLHEPPDPQDSSFLLSYFLPLTTRPAPQIWGKDTQPKAELDYFSDLSLISALAKLTQSRFKNNDKSYQCCDELS